jgi:hypothetical protein
MQSSSQQKLTTKEIGAQLIQNVYKRYPEWEQQNLTLPKQISPIKLNKVFINKKLMAKVPLDPIHKSVLCGTLFGDTSFSINKGYANARFQAKHSTRQVEWFTWKYLVLLKEFCSISSVVYTPPDGYQRNSPLKPGETILGKLKLASKVSETLTSLHSVICKNNRKTIKRSWLNHMNNYFLMTLWLDDGSLYNDRQGVFCLNSTPAAQQRILREYLLTVWDIQTEMRVKKSQPTLKNGLPNYVIHIKDQTSLMRLLRLVAPIIPVREMLDKVCFFPKNPSLLQRWRTELENLVRPEFKQYVIDYYNAKSAKLEAKKAKAAAKKQKTLA